MASFLYAFNEATKRRSTQSVQPLSETTRRDAADLSRTRFSEQISSAIFHTPAPPIAGRGLTPRESQIVLPRATNQPLVCIRQGAGFLPSPKNEKGKQRDEIRTFRCVWGGQVRACWRAQGGAVRRCKRCMHEESEPLCLKAVGARKARVESPPQTSETRL